jgi:hypothetical protein
MTSNTCKFKMSCINKGFIPNEKCEKNELSCPYYKDMNTKRRIEIYTKKNQKSILSYV